MQNAHVAHNCRIGDATIIAGGALAGGARRGRRSRLRLRELRGPSARAHRPPRALARIVAYEPRRPALLHHGRDPYRAGRERDRSPARRVRRRGRRGDPAGRRAVSSGVRPISAVRSRASRPSEITDDVRELIAFVRASKRGVCVSPPASAPRAARTAPSERPSVAMARGSRVHSTQSAPDGEKSSLHHRRDHHRRRRRLPRLHRHSRDLGLLPHDRRVPRPVARRSQAKAFASPAGSAARASHWNAATLDLKFRLANFDDGTTASTSRTTASCPTCSPKVAT